MQLPGLPTPWEPGRPVPTAAFPPPRLPPQSQSPTPRAFLPGARRGFSRRPARAGVRGREAGGHARSGFPGEGGENNRSVWAEPAGRGEGGGHIASSCTFYWKRDASGGGAGRRPRRRQWPDRARGRQARRRSSLRIPGGRLNSRAAPGRARARAILPPAGPRARQNRSREVVARSE